MATKLWAAFLVLLTTFLTSSAQILYKIGSKSLNLADPISILSNYPLLGGILLYVIGGSLIITALKGGEVSVLYPIIAMSYIWVSLLSVYFLGETMNPLKWAGVSSIILGIIFIGFGSRSSLEAA